MHLTDERQLPAKARLIVTISACVAALAAAGLASVVTVAPADAASTEPTLRAPYTPGVSWGIADMTVRWEAVPGAARYVVTVKAQHGVVKTYKSSVFPSNQATIPYRALPQGPYRGYSIRVQAASKTGRLSAYSAPPRARAVDLTMKVTVKKGDSASVRKAVKHIGDCEKAGGVGGAVVGAGYVVTAFFTGGTSALATAPFVAAFMGGATSGVVGCIVKKINPSLVP